MRHAVVLFIVIAAAVSAGCSGDCSGDFCVEVLDSAFEVDRCAPDAGTTCTFAAVHFSATEKGAPISDSSELTATMTVNGRDVGAEGASSFSTSGPALAVQLLLDRSFSVREAGAEASVRDAATRFIDSLPAAAKVRVLVFASEVQVPILVVAPECATNVGDFMDKDAAKQTVADCYAAHDAATSVAQTRLYDAVASVPAGRRGVPNVLVVFTDGADTASMHVRTPEAARDALRSRIPNMKIFAVGLGAAPSEAALTTLSDGKFFRADDSAALDGAFAAVGSDLRSIHVFRSLVAGREAGTEGTLEVTHKERTVEKRFTIQF